ncbi:MAG: RdgB/HAM1 family non-canonical purine NTP pyrophosphatase [Verrucomicrobiota bacterium]|nr:RdgB/HAM1 family non-canonical purine NTP pyrophosphatase [Limisphaera sp.]MDW8381990.1 RdgB/HAM1 family non-canonical purine NTP pyrophosphatase [Verrucomicrobiota bacterium]
MRSLLAQALPKLPLFGRVVLDGQGQFRSGFLVAFVISTGQSEQRPQKGIGRLIGLWKVARALPLTAHSRYDGSVETVLLATHNRHKVEELRRILGRELDYRILTDWPDPPRLEETGTTFVENATAKVRQVLEWLKTRLDTDERAQFESPWWVLADDSGLEVDALNGLPGVYSARFAALDSGSGGNSPDAENNAKLLRLLQDVPEPARRARFRCVIAVGRWPWSGGPIPLRWFEGVCEGRVLKEPRGLGGFGYDPLFQPEGYDQTFAEMQPELKNRISHRARALAKLAHWWQQHGGPKAPAIER